MQSYSHEAMADIPVTVLHQLKQLQPEMISLLRQAPQFGIASLEVHFVDGEIRRIVRHREESLLFTKGQ